MGLPRRLKLVHTVGAGATFTTTLPQRPWTSWEQKVGGGERTAVPSIYVIRHEPMMDLDLRIYEGTEQAAFVAFLRAVDDAGASFTVYPDADSLTSLTMYLEHPSVLHNEAIRPTGRDEGDPSVLNYVITVRRTTDGIISQEYYGE